ncbi:MAG: alpha/beta fold hydrolase [Gammaproteobacteria bacterium]|nr:alpha/beta fold hydrolase [Gammaproteobacteria bacterium]
MASIIGNAASGRLSVLYVHGLFMTGLEGTLLLRRLRRRGFDGGRFVFSSLREEPVETAEKLAKQLAVRPDLHLVGHSLGGVIAARAIARSPDWRGRAVLLGPPLTGSATARRAAELPGGRLLLGRGGRWLAGAVPRVRGQDRIRVIAGTRNVGMGRLIGACAGPGDGQVRVIETRLGGATHVTRRRGHFALVFDRRVARLTADFLHAARAEDEA